MHFLTRRAETTIGQQLERGVIRSWQACPPAQDCQEFSLAPGVRLDTSLHLFRMVHRHDQREQFDIDYVMHTLNPNRGEIRVIKHVKRSKHRMRLLVRDPPYCVYASHAAHTGVVAPRRIMNLPP